MRRPWKPSFRTSSPAPARQSRASLAPWLWSRLTVSPCPPCLAHHRRRKLQAASLFEPFIVDRFHGACLPPEQPALRPSLLLPVSPAASSPFLLSLTISLSHVVHRKRLLLPAPSRSVAAHGAPPPTGSGAPRPDPSIPAAAGPASLPPEPCSPVVAVAKPLPLLLSNQGRGRATPGFVDLSIEPNRPAQRAPAGLLLSIVLGRGPW